MTRGLPSVGIVQRVREYFSRYVLRRCKYPSPQDSWVLFAHCPLTFFSLWAVFFAVYQGYFSDEVIHCASQGGGLQELTDPVKLDICVQYSHIDLDDGVSKGSILNYLWHPYVLLTICALVYLPQLVKKVVSHKGIEHFFSKVNSGHGVCDFNEEASQYCYDFVGSHGGHLFASLKVSLTCLLVDLMSVVILDSSSQNTFYNSIMHFPYTRDMANYERVFSRVFPPTARCSITPTMQISLQNTENYGCSLPLNWYYEKVYILLFVYFAILLIVSVVSVLMDLWRMLPCRRHRLVSMGGHYVNWSKDVAQHWSLDELSVLNYFRGFVDHDTFVDIMGHVVAIRKTSYEVLCSILSDEDEV
ncbi:uncharacterized protein [Panulirus ornatus]|uniref:uncharacterized protein n=1 Tax=Panulirus ornatus TaxID=150431 RepID=UPI003A8A1C3C